jgi:hypothetical protein
MVRMERQKAHIAAGLVPERKARRFSLADDEQPATAAEEDESDPTDFDQMADTLIGLANTSDNDDDDDEEFPPTPAFAAVPLRPAASGNVPNASGRIPAYKKIKLAKLFNYPTAGSPAHELEFFWQGGRDAVEEEEEEMAAAASEGDGVQIDSDVATAGS